MDKGFFYFLSDEYFDRFDNRGLMRNKSGDRAGRPCFYAFQDRDHSGLFWMVPISSKIEKYRWIYAQKTKKRKDYDGLVFGYVLGKEAVFLLQNICPITEEYVVEKYNLKDGAAVSIPEKKKKEINRKAIKLVELSKKGIRCTLSDAYGIYRELLKGTTGVGLKFGTGGLRGKLGDGPDHMNIYTVTRTTQGLANYIHGFGDEAAKKGVVIAYDSRRMSIEFAEATALCLNANNIPTYMFDALRPTPELSFAVRHLNCVAGVVITASHNPPEYNGYKVYWEDGAQITPPHDKGIMDCVEDISDDNMILTMDRSVAVSNGFFHIIGEEIDEVYYEAVLAQTIHREILGEWASKVRIVYTPLHGTGSVPVQVILKRLGFENVYVVSEQEKPDGQFPTVKSPNPENPSAFTLALELARKIDADIVLATDPDADRLGVYVKDASKVFYETIYADDDTYPYMRFNGNMTGALIEEYVCRERALLGTLPRDGVVASTIVSSNLSRIIAERYGLEYREFLTGFKYIGNMIHDMELSGQGRFVYGMEESFGCLVGDYTRDKDACGAVVMLCEMAAFYMSKGRTLCDTLDDMYQKYGYYYETQKSEIFDAADGDEKMSEMVKSYRDNPPSYIDGKKVIAVRDYLTGRRKDLNTGLVSDIDLPKSDVIYLEFEDDEWLAIRPSGTEPKVKIYREFLVK